MTYEEMKTEIVKILEENPFLYDYILSRLSHDINGVLPEIPPELVYEQAELAYEAFVRNLKLGDDEEKNNKKLEFAFTFMLKIKEQNEAKD